MIYNRATIEDKEEIIQLERDCLVHPWSEEDIERMLNESRYVVVTARENKKIVGYVGASFVCDEAEIGNICVAMEHRRRGIAETLLHKLFTRLGERMVKKVFLEVEATNLPAKFLYQKLGFELYNTRHDYYGYGRDAELLKIDL